MRRIEKKIIKQLIVFRSCPSGSFQTASIGAGRYFRVGVLDRVNNYVYFAGDDALVTRIPRNYQGPMGGSPYRFELFPVGAGDLISFSLDYKNSQMYIGTSTKIDRIIYSSLSCLLLFT